MADSWIKETVALIEELQARKERLHSKLEETRQEIQELDKRIEGGDSLLRTYRDKYSEPNPQFPNSNPPCGNPPRGNAHICALVDYVNVTIDGGRLLL